jgi:glucose-6-phosphate isomerase
LTELELHAPEVEAVIERLRQEDVIGQILERRGRMAELATEAGDVKLDWADQVAWALDHPDAIAGVEALAASIRSRFEQVIWSGMGGSIQAVHTLLGLGLFEGGGIKLHPLDSTDPAALNDLLADVAGEGGLRDALQRTLMVGVSMGMTSEEPITHLRWFDALLRRHGIESPGDHVMVMTLPGSFLDEFALETGSVRVDIQLDGESHIPGRMSAPSTRVFLLPAALAKPGGLRDVLERCEADAGLHPTMLERDPFVRLAGWLAVQMEAGRDMLVLDLPPRWAAVAPWVEQVVEESLGKDGRGLMIFYEQELRFAAEWPDRFSILRIDEGSGEQLPDRPLASLRLDGASDLAARLATTARFFAGWNLAVALVGYAQGIAFAGQPAVELYKSYARRLRDAPGELPYPTENLASTRSGGLELFSGAASVADLDGHTHDAASTLAAVVRGLKAARRLAYFDLTINGDATGPLWKAALMGGRRFGNEVLRRPVKIRCGPRDYHSTEQSEIAGAPELLSLRVLVRDPELVADGEYSARFLHAQALGTLFAMRDAGRPVLLASVRRAHAAEALDELLDGATAELNKTRNI